jgi:SOS-response transcriptional repressor LexA
MDAVSRNIHLRSNRQVILSSVVHVSPLRIGASVVRCHALMRIRLFYASDLMRIVLLTLYKNMRMCMLRHPSSEGRKMTNMSKKIKALRISLGLTQPEFGKKLHPEDPVPQSTVSKWEKNKQNPDVENSRLIAALAGMTFEEWTELPNSAVTPAMGRRIPVIGAVQAGEWLEAVEWAEDDRYEVSAPLPAAWANVPMHALEVRGDSFNKVYPNGSIVYVAPIEYVPGAPKSGDVVVAVRRDEDGAHEITLKEYVVEGGQKWLLPRSHSLEFQTPLSFVGGNKKTAEVRIAGVVITGMVMTAAAGRRTSGMK